MGIHLRLDPDEPGFIIGGFIADCYTGSMLNHMKLKHPKTVGSVGANSSNAVNSASGVGRQSRMDTFVTSRHCGPDKANKINDMITDMVATSH